MMMSGALVCLSDQVRPCDVSLSKLRLPMPQNLCILWWSCVYFQRKEFGCMTNASENVGTINRMLYSKKTTELWVDLHFVLVGICYNLFKNDMDKKSKLTFNIILIFYYTAGCFFQKSLSFISTVLKQYKVTFPL